MKVVLTHGYFLHEDPKEQQIMRPYPPLGILCLSAYLEQHGVENALFDTTFSTKKAFRDFLLEHRPPYLAIYINLMTKLNVLGAIRFIRSREELQHTRIILGGPDITYNVDNYLQAGADILVIGEGEQTLLELIHALDVPVNPFLDNIAGIAYRNALGEVHKTPPRQKIKEVDELPFPNRGGIDLQQYLDVWKKHHGYSTVSVNTQRGCPYTCRWCSTAVYGQSYRRRSPANVVAELKHLQEKYRPAAIWFVDDVFTVSHKWLEAFRDTLRQERVRIRFECITRADRLSERVMQHLKACGCFRVWIGAESGSQEIIDAMDRRVEVTKVRQMIQLARKYNIETGTFIMLGYPGETEQDIRQTVAHLQRSDPDWFTITVTYPIKGTALYRQVEKALVNHLDWQKSTDRELDFQRTYPRRYYDYAVRWVVNEVNFHKKRLRHGHRSPGALLLKLKALAARGGMWLEKQRA